MNEQNSRSKKLLDKVYDHLDTIDVAALSMDELKDFLEVVQKGRFLETIGQVPNFGFGGFGGNKPPENSGNDSGDGGAETKE